MLLNAIMGHYIPITLPLLLIPSWALATDPFLILPGPGPCPLPMCGGRGAVRREAGGPFAEGPGGVRVPSRCGGSMGRDPARSRRDQ